MNRLSFVILLVLFVECQITQAADTAPSRPSLETGFECPVDTDKPWAYWWWLNGNVDKKTITRDMEALR